MDNDSPKPFLRRFFSIILMMLSLTISLPSSATSPDIALSVWVNEAIVSAYSFNESNMLDRQKEMAKYFTSQGWINFTKALDSSKLKESIKKNHYTVSAVALLPPKLQHSSVKNEWQASMPLMVLYQNKDYQQKQSLDVSITFETAQKGEGVRGHAITSFKTLIIDPPCQCQNQHALKTIV